jgi:hypothetical protein
MNITNHCKERYVERIVGITTTNELKQYIVLNNDKIVDDIGKLIEYGDIIYTGQINGDKSTKNYLKNGQMIVVMDTGNTTAITLYKIDFGFGEKTDKILTTSILEELNGISVEIENAKAKVNDNVSLRTTEITNIENEIEYLKQQMSTLNLKKDTLENEVKIANSEVETVNKKYEFFALKLCNSAEYRKDLAKLNTK